MSRTRRILTALLAAAGALITVAPVAAHALPVGPNGFHYAAAEGGSVTLASRSDVAFGVNGKFRYIYAISGAVTCSDSIFGDPAPFVHKACFVHADNGPKAYTFQAIEGAPFTITGADLAFGGDGKFRYAYGIHASVLCTVGGFGDPEPFVHKSCYVNMIHTPRAFSYAGTENVHLTLAHRADVAFGANGHFVFKYGVTGGINCTTSVFGDPETYVHKSCFWHTDAGPSGFTYAGTEGSAVKLSRRSDVAYGANGKFKYQYGVTGTVSCTNAVFGDPFPGVHKACYVRNH